MGVDLRRLLTDVDRLLNVLVITDDDVEPDNRVTLSRTLPPDEHGPIPRVDMNHRRRSRRTTRNRESITREAVRLLRAAGAREIYRIGWPPLILHVQSTMRMGVDPATSVLNRNGRARFVRGLYVADNSALANGLGGPNPTPTTQALATRTAERIFRTEFGGDYWVRSEAPVSSVDREVTNAVLGRRCNPRPASPAGGEVGGEQRRSRPRRQPSFTG